MIVSLVQCVHIYFNSNSYDQLQIRKNFKAIASNGCRWYVRPDFVRQLKSKKSCLTTLKRRDV
jgi:hypothetical protein